MLSVLRPIHLRVDPTANSQRLEESKFSETRGYRTTHGRVDASRCQCKRRREGSTAHRMTLCVPQRNQPPASRTARHVTSTFQQAIRNSALAHTQLEQLLQDPILVFSLALL